MYRIPSIHHYCNRWCERCALRQMCGFFHAQNSGNEIDPGEWSENLGTTEARNEFQDLDLEAVQNLPRNLKAKERRGSFNPDQSQTLQTFDIWQGYYADFLKALDQWWKGNPQHTQAFIRSAAFQRQYNARAVLLHYRNFVGPKLHRALGGLFDADGITPEQSDWNGSAKVVYLALEHILKVLPDLRSLDEQAPHLLDTWEICTRDLQESVQEDFPDLAQFLRPGFDTLGEGRI